MNGKLKIPEQKVFLVGQRVYLKGKGVIRKKGAALQRKHKNGNKIKLTMEHRYIKIRRPEADTCYHSYWMGPAQHNTGDWENSMYLYI